MSQFYNRLQATTLRLITDKGTDCLIISAPMQGGFDPVTGLPADDLPQLTQSGKCLVLNYGDSLINAPDSLIERGDKKLLVSASGIKINGLNGTVEALGSVYSIMAIKDLNPAGTTLLYEIHGRE